LELNGLRKVVKIWSKNVSQNWTKIGQSPWIVPVGTGPGSGFDRVARCAARLTGCAWWELILGAVAARAWGEVAGDGAWPCADASEARVRFVEMVASCCGLV
jgi:hypothetical protein